jgi:hypothetical protein
MRIAWLDACTKKAKVSGLTSSKCFTRVDMIWHFNVGIVYV